MESITRGAGAFNEVPGGVGKTPFGGGKSGDSIIIGGMKVAPFGGGKSGESTIIGGMVVMP